MLRPVFAVVLLTMVVAAVRIFDLVVLVVPDPARAGKTFCSKANG